MRASLGDSIYEARLFVRGAVKSLGADCIEKAMRPSIVAILAELLDKAGSPTPGRTSSSRYGSARRLYNFHVDNADAY